MAGDNFQDQVKLSSDGVTLAHEGNAFHVGDGLAGAKSIGFLNDAGRLELAGDATANATVYLPAAGGTLAAVSGVLASLSAGTTRITSGEAVFSNANGLSFGVDGQTVTGSYTRPVASNALQDVGTATGSGANTSRFAADDHVHRGILAVGASGGNTAGDTGSRFGVVVVAGGAGVVVSQATGAVSNTLSIVNSWSTATTVSAVASANAIGANAGRFALEGHQHAGLNTVSIVGNTSGDTSAGPGSLVLAGGPNVTLSCSTAAGGMTVSISGGAGAGGGDVIAAGTQTATGGTVLFSDSNGISFGMSGSTRVTASYTVPVVSNALQNVGSATGSGTNTSRFAADDHVHAGLNTLSIVGNTSGTTTAGPGSVVLAGGPNVTLSCSTAAGGMTVSLSAPSGGGGSTYSSTVFGRDMRGPGPTSSSSSLGQNSLYLYPHIALEYVHLSAIKMVVAVTNSSSGAASIQNGRTVSFAVYTRHATNSTVLTRHYSTSYTFAASHSSNASWMLSMITAIVNSTSYGTTSTSSAGVNISSLAHGIRDIIMPWNTTLAPGEYWIAVHNSTSSAGGAGNMGWSHIVAIATSGNRLGVAINATNAGALRNMPWGSYSATTNAMPGGISFTQVNQSAIAPLIYGFHDVTE